MIICKIIINISILIFLIKTISLIWSLFGYKINYKRFFKEKSLGELNDDNYKGKILFVVLLNHNEKEVKDIIPMYQNILLGYKKGHVIFVTNEQEEIEFKMAHRDGTTTRREVEKYIDEVNKQLDRKDAVKLIHYPYDNDNKAQMVDYAVKEFNLDYSTVDKMQSYVGILEGYSILEEAFITRFDKTINKYHFPKVIETIKVKTYNVFKINKIKNYLNYLHNANVTMNEVIKNNFYMNLRKIFGLNKILPFNSKINGTFIRLDSFLEEEMLSTANIPEAIFANYYLKNAYKKVMYTEVDEKVIDDTILMNKDLENEYVVYHAMKKQSKSIKKYRIVSKFRNALLNIHNDILIIYNSFTPYVVFVALMILIFSNKLSLNLLLYFLSSMYLYSFLMITSYRYKSKCYDYNENKFKKFIIRLLSFIMYPIYLVYRSNGLYDYIRTRSLVNSKYLNENVKDRR